MHKDIMIDRIEELGQIHVNGDTITLPDILAYLINGIMSRPARSETIAVIRETRIKDWH